MNPVRAAASVSTSNTLHLVPDWPRLPDWLKLEIVSSVAADSRGRVHVAHRHDHPLFRLHPDGEFDCEIGVDGMRPSMGYDVLNHPQPVAMGMRPWLHGLYVDQWDCLWVTDVGRHLVF